MMLSIEKKKKENSYSSLTVKAQMKENLVNVHLDQCYREVKHSLTLYFINDPSLG